jgi:hypothetical protein
MTTAHETARVLIQAHAAHIVARIVVAVIARVLNSR